MIHIADSQTDKILGFIPEDEFWNDVHKKSLKDTLETFDFTTFADREYAEHLAKRNRIIIPDEDGRYIEFIIENTRKYRDTDGSLLMEVYSVSSYLELAKAKTIEPQTLSDQTPNMALGFALEGTGWLPGRIEGSGTRTFHIDQYTNPYSFTKTIATEYKLERNFRVEHDGNKITGRFLDLVERIGMWRGREVEFGKDLIGIERKEDFSNIVTALIGLGPEREDGTRLEVFVEDKDALARWGRNGRHIIEVYEPESTDQTMTEARLRELTQNELEKRINSIVEYTADIADLEKVPGLEHEKIRFGDTIRIKDTQFNPPLYLEARVHTMERSIKKNGYKTVTLGDYIEYAEEEIDAIWNQLRNEIKRRLDRMAIVSITSTAGNVFKNAQGETQLTARTFVNGAERDEDGTLYDYQWMRFDKDGNHDTEFYAEGKTITVTANDIDEKATYRVLVAYELEVINTAEITISNVFDGEDGEPGPPGPKGDKGDKGEDGKTFYTWIKYADTPTSGMSDNPEGKEYIGIAYNKETPTPSTNYDDYVWAKFKGEQGIPGPPGEDGQPTYIWVKYADDEHGNGMSDSPDGKLYIGLAFNKTTPQESNNPADYTWSLMPQNIEIGGRNYVIGNPEHNSVGSGYSKSFSVSKDLVNDFNTSEKKSFTMSCDIEINNATPHPSLPGTLRIGFEISLYDTNGTRHIFHCHYFPEQGETKKFRFTKTFNFDFEITEVRQSYIYTLVENGKVSKLKIELGHKATDWTAAPEDVQEQIDEAKQEAGEAKQEAEQAKQEAEEAKQAAQQAQTTADGKNSVFHSPTAPPTAGRKIGDIWFDTSRDNLMHRFNGTQWVEAKWGEQSIVANSITANHIKSLVGLNVNDQFIVDSQGNVKFAGHLEGASGTFGEVTVNEGNITIKDAFSNVKQILTPKPNLIGDHSFEDVLVDWDTENPQYNWYDMINPPYAGSDFSIHRPYWTKTGSPKVAKKPDYGVWDYRALPIFDGQAIVVRDANFVRQYIAEGIGAGGTYTISGYFKRHWGQSPGIPRFEIDHMRSGQRLSRLINQTFERVPNDYTVVRFATTFTLPSNFQEGDYLDIKVSGGDSNWVQCDGVQLVEGNLPCIYDPEITAYEAKRKTEVFTEPLWQGAVYLRDDHMIYPMLPLTQCKTGWILQWQAYDPGVGIANSNYQYTHIPKASLKNVGRGHRVLLIRGSATYVNKYFYVYDTYITGVADNGQGDNRNLVLSAIYEY